MTIMSGEEYKQLMECLQRLEVRLARLEQYFKNHDSALLTLAHDLERTAKAFAENI